MLGGVAWLMRGSWGFCIPIRSVGVHLLGKQGQRQQDGLKVCGPQTSIDSQPSFEFIKIGVDDNGLDMEVL